jgi:hypothetical protein
MPGRGTPTFLKRQKEQARVARANAKRAEKQARRERRTVEAQSDQTPDEELPAESDNEDPTPDTDPVS